MSCELLTLVIHFVHIVVHLSLALSAINEAIKLTEQLTASVKLCSNSMLN